MNKFKYIIFIIIGILLFLLLNTTNTFSIGNQYQLNRIYTDHTDPNSIADINPNVVLKTMYDTIINPRENICMSDFEQCYITMHNLGGGSCQINTLIGLYQTVLKEVEVPLINMTLSLCNGNQIKAANLLGINRNTLRKKIKDYDLVITRGKKLM